MNPGRFFLPNFSTQFNPLSGVTYLPNRGGFGLFGRMVNSMKRFNWNGLLNGANKTLNVVNQTIPLVRQAGPMVNNMRNMFKIAKAFGNETTKNVNSTNVVKEITQQKKQDKFNSVTNKKEVMNNNYPNFFV